MATPLSALSPISSPFTPLALAQNASASRYRFTVLGCIFMLVVVVQFVDISFLEMVTKGSKVDNTYYGLKIKQPLQGKNAASKMPRGGRKMRQRDFLDAKDSNKASVEEVEGGTQMETEDMILVKREEHDYYTQHALSLKEDASTTKALVQEIKQLGRQYDSKAYDSKGGFHSIREQELTKDTNVLNARKEGKEQQARKIESDYKEMLAARKAGKVEKKYRAIVCAIVRNDFHMREFVVRNLLQGFNHIVLYDNNQIGRGIDHNITSLLQPFVDEDMLTLIPFHQSSDEKYLRNGQKNRNSETCIDTYGIYADWAIAMDTDEVIYIRNTEMTNADDKSQRISTDLGDPSESEPESPSGASIGHLHTLLDDMEKKLPDSCALSFPWRMMDGNHTVLSYPDKLLLDQFTRICKIHEAPKVLLRPDYSDTQRMPHFTSCRGGLTTQFSMDDPFFFKETMKNKYYIHNIHYYAKSVEEFINKSEQSIPPYIRLLKDAYDHARKCKGKEVIYDTVYKETVHRMMKGLKISQGQLPDAGEFLGPLPEFKPDAIDEYTKYMFFKTRVTLRDEWDEEQYLLQHSEIAEAVQNKLFIDGLQHYIEDGFDGGYSSCWIRQGGESDASFFTTHLHQKKAFCID